MLRKLASALAVAFAVTLAFASTATAAPYDPATFSVSALGGNAYQISGSGFGDEVADDFVTISLSYGNAPQGLRAAAGLAAAAKADSYTADVDDDGNFSTVVTASQDGTVYFTVVGSPSGETRSGQLVKGSGGGSVSTTTAGAGSYSSGGGSSGGSQGAYNSDYAATGAYNSGTSLASTGASIAGPMAIGLGTLTVGLGLLFFGTRGVIRRKRPNIS